MFAMSRGPFLLLPLLLLAHVLSAHGDGEGVGEDVDEEEEAFLLWQSVLEKELGVDR